MGDMSRLHMCYGFHMCYGLHMSVQVVKVWLEKSLALKIGEKRMERLV